jgi:hypothetical protein
MGGTGETIKMAANTLRTSLTNVSHHKTVPLSLPVSRPALHRASPATTSTSLLGPPSLSKDQSTLAGTTFKRLPLGKMRSAG